MNEWRIETVGSSRIEEHAKAIADARAEGFEAGLAAARAEGIMATATVDSPVEAPSIPLLDEAVSHIAELGDIVNAHAASIDDLASAISALNPVIVNQRHDIITLIESLVAIESHLTQRWWRRVFSKFVVPMGDPS